jgi:hypothetical protein
MHEAVAVIASSELVAFAVAALMMLRSRRNGPRLINKGSCSVHSWPGALW